MRRILSAILLCGAAAIVYMAASSPSNAQAGQQKEFSAKLWDWLQKADYENWAPAPKLGRRRFLCDDRLWYMAWTTSAAKPILSLGDVFQMCVDFGHYSFNPYQCATGSLKPRSCNKIT